MDDLGFKTTKQMPPKQKRKSKYTDFLNKVKKSKRIYVKAFDDKKKAHSKAVYLRKLIESHHIEGVEVVVRDCKMFVFSKDVEEGRY